MLFIVILLQAEETSNLESYTDKREKNAFPPPFFYDLIETLEENLFIY